MQSDGVQGDRVARLPDKRLEERLGSMVERLGRAPGQRIVRACKNWAEAKAAYRFLG